MDLAESVGSTALAPRPAADPDEVTDTGARRARSAFRLATEDDEDDETDEAEHDEPEDEHATSTSRRCSSNGRSSSPRR